MDQDDAASAISPAEYIAVLRRRRWLLVLVPLLLASVAYWLASQREPMYTASAQLLVTQSSSLGVTTSSDIQAASLLAQTYADLITSAPVLERVIAELELSATVPELAAHVDAEAGTLTQLIEVSAEYSDPELAATVATRTAEAFVTWLSDHQAATLSESSRALEQSIAQARADMEGATAELAELRGRPGARTAEENGRIASLEALIEQHRNTYTGLLELQERLQLARLAELGNVSVVNQARPPGQPTGLPDIVYAALAFVLGLGLSGLGIGLAETANRRIQGARDVDREVGLPVLASIPHSRRIRPSAGLVTLEAPQSAAAEAFRALRTRFQFAVNGRGTGTVVVTSPEPDDAMPEIASNLAVSLAQTGQRVVLVEGDLRGSWHQHGAGRPETRAGLMSLLAKPSLPVEEALVPGPHPQLLLLPIGSEAALIPPTPLARLEAIISSLRCIADVVVIDAPSVLPASDTLLLAGVTDDVILVARVGRTRPSALRAAVETLRMTGTNVLGVVLYGGDPAAAWTR
jgi:tyrosine-protein kinase Etk/Wzc